MTDTAPDLAQYVTGYRSWRIGPGHTIKAMVATAGWTPGVNKAECIPVDFLTFGYQEGPHKAPCTGCHCGFYAVHEKCKDEAPGGEVYGVVRAHGDIEVHADGFRAEFVEVVAFADPATVPLYRDLTDDARQAQARTRFVGELVKCVKARAVRYGVPMVPWDDLERVALEHGGPVPVSLRPEPAPEPEDDGGSDAFTTTMPAAQTIQPPMASDLPGWHGLAYMVAVAAPFAIAITLLTVLAAVALEPVSLVAAAVGMAAVYGGGMWASVRAICRLDGWLGRRRHKATA